MNNFGLLLVNKPTGITSHDLVIKARRALGISKIGHTGTLDPMAEGLMILTVGKTTKLLPYIVHHDKEYVAEMIFGRETDSDDITGNTIVEQSVPELSEEMIKEVLKSFLGTYWQIPPMYSAKKVNGQKLYELARKNVEIEREPVEVFIHELELLEKKENSIVFRCHCSSGTYIRVLCHDIAHKLGTVGCMSALKRTAISSFRLEEAFSIEQLEDRKIELRDPIEALNDYPLIEYENLEDVRNGKRIELDIEEDIAFIVEGKELIAVYERETEKVFCCRRGLW